jgi:DNA-binding transcriptional LysR family regulator
MGRHCAEFHALYPEVTVEVVAEDRVVDLVEEQFDVAIRPNPRPDTTLVGRSFAKDQLVVVAAPSVQMPRRSKKPTSVPAIVNAFRDGETWALDGGSLTLEPIPVLRLSSMLMLRDAAIAGAVPR